jgi:tRNA/tmRNA/rRNA uracil-C5-methylase (TrmA/RlmC/RlmD family)
MESFDEELDFVRHSNHMKDEIKRMPQMKDMNESYELYDSRRERSPNLYERAKQLDFHNNQYNNDYKTRNVNRNTGNYENRHNSGKNYRNRYESNQSYENDLSYDKDFDYEDNHQNRQNNNYQRFDNRKNRFQNSYDRRNQFQNYDNRNQYQNYENRNQFQNYENRNQYQNYENRNQFQNYENRNPNDGYEGQNQTEDRRQARHYQNYKKRNIINEFNDSDSNDFNDLDDNKFRFENGRPRFSKFREQEFNANRKERRIDKFNNRDNDNEETLDLKEYEVKDTEEIEGNDKEFRERKLVSIPYNVTLENRFEIVNQIVTPLHLKPYEHQLNIKYRKNIEILQKLGKKLKDIQSPVVRDAKGLPCPLELVKPSPQTEKYRNKDEYSIWPGVDGFRKTVGFFVGQPSIHHNVVCVEPDHIIVSKDSHKSLAKKFQTYLKEISKYDSCENFGKGGNWRRFHVRSNESGNHMAIAIMHPQQLSQQELDEEMARVRQYFDGDQRISSLYFQAAPHTRCTNEQAPYHLLSGDKTIKESLLEKQFEISADSFFQINRSGAEVLYRNVISELNASKKTTVLDICCGTGTLANLIAPDVCRVIGIDSSHSAINDAKNNASLNNIKNASFIVGTVEEQLPKLIDELYSQDIVVVANPTRAGLHSSVINSLREMSYIHKLVYVSCYPEGDSFKNFVHLCMPASKQNQKLGSPFVPTNAIPVDLFPHTNHCELIITFERF